ncbi:MAG: aldo/keto reductase [Prevotellaceae bacterium]|jgi:L-glyceraldehyde 3-phosphate reductase|nr:aldo/keto reductase [Prevotellaceae bacterium]
MKYAYCGKSGLQLPRISLGLWHNFGDVDRFDVAVDIVKYAFESGITHFDLANNYGPPAGSAEVNFGRILKTTLAGHRDELVISTKAGHLMFPGPYGDGGSRKSLIGSLDQSLKRMGLEYVDIFYSHRYDPSTPIEETMQALIDVVKQGKALYAGISKYPVEQAEKAYQILAQQHVPCLVNQDRYSLLTRNVEQGVLDAAERNGVGFVAFSPLAQGLLTSKYLQDIPQNSRAAKPHGFLQREQVTEEVVKRVARLNELAARRGQSLAEMAIAWLLKDTRVTSVIVGASSVEQLRQNTGALNNTGFTDEELDEILKV